MTEPPHVLFLSQAPGVGGGERAVMQALARAEGLRVTVAAHRPVCLFAERCGLEPIELVLPRAQKPVDVLRLPASGARVRRLARRLSADVLYANGIRAVGGGVAARVLGGPPMLVHHHGQFGSGPLRPYVAAIRRWADLIVTDSDWSARPFGTTPKLRVVPNGIDLERFRPSADGRAAKAAFGVPQDASVVGMLARPHPSKGSEAFLQLTPSLENVHFLLAGGPAFPGEDALYAQLQQRVADGPARVSLTGYLDDPRQAYAAMDVLVHLGRAEGLSLVLLEAWASRLPVVAYDRGAIGETIDDGVTGLLAEPDDLESVAEAVRRLIADPALAARLSQAARTSCEQRYDIDRMARHLTDAVSALA